MPPEYEEITRAECEAKHRAIDDKQRDILESLKTIERAVVGTDDHIGLRGEITVIKERLCLFWWVLGAVAVGFLTAAGATIWSFIASSQKG
jgi:hypothetical protein